jgi:hypothetical protein
VGLRSWSWLQGYGYWFGFPSPLPSDIFSLLPGASVSKGLVSAPQSMQIQTFLVPSGRWLLCAQSMHRMLHFIRTKRCDQDHTSLGLGVCGYAYAYHVNRH